jgi:hypothetical protein
MPKMKDYFIGQASGLSKDGPKLLAGEMI